AARCVEQDAIWLPAGVRGEDEVHIEAAVPARAQAVPGQPAGIHITGIEGRVTAGEAEIACRSGHAEVGFIIGVAAAEGVDVIAYIPLRRGGKVLAGAIISWSSGNGSRTDVLRWNRVEAPEIVKVA